MDASTSRRRHRAPEVISTVAAVMAVSSCSLPGAGGACTALGTTEGVSVDLTGSLDPRGGSYLAEVCLPGLGACGSWEVTADDQHGVSARVDADLTAGPVTVVVTVRDAAGGVVLEKSTSATPRLYQPNGARCDGENHRIALGLDADERLTPRPLP